jgi:predicted Zn-dependent peptidase
VVPDVKLIAWLLPCLALACHGGIQGTTPKPPPAERDYTAQAGIRVVTLPRSTPGVVRLSLYIDAGSRDASPPQAATVAAWLAAEHASAAVESLVYPDVTELSRTCESNVLDRCVVELARTLSFRAPTAAQLVHSQARLEDLRRRALAADPDRPVDELAATSLLGDAAWGFFPLGRAVDDPQLTAASVDQLLRDHYGPQRALLVAAGEVDADQLGELVSREFSKLVAARAVRSHRQLEPAAEPKLQTALDNRGSSSFALIAQDEAALRSQVRVLGERLLDGRIDGHVFAVRGAAFALVRIPGDALQLLPRATRELVRLRLEPPPMAAASTMDDDLASISRVVGLGFGTGAESAEAPLRAMQFGAGALIVGGAGAGPKLRDQQEQSDAKLLEQAESLFQRALAIDDPRTSGARDEYGTALSVENGARIDVQFARGPDVAIAVRIGLGAEQDPAELHGRSALLASLTASACAGMGPELLRDELAQLGATMEPRVAAESYGLLVRAPVEQWQAALDFALRCARAPSRDTAYFASAALRLQARLASDGGELGLRARIANQISPRAPGMLAPWGDPGRLGNLSPRDIADAFRSSEVGVRWSIAVVGAVPVEDATARIARRISDLPPGALPKAAEPGQPPAAAYSAPSSASLESRTLLATWDVRGEYPHRLGAAVFASAMHAVLALAPGVEVVWQDADVYGAGAYAALQLRVGPEALPQMAALLRESAVRLGDDVLDEAVERGVGLAQRTQSADDAEAGVRAERVARTRLGAKLGPVTREQAKALVVGLKKAAVRVSVMR